MGWECSCYDRKVKCVKGFLGVMRESGNLIDLDRRTIVKWMVKKLIGLAWTGLIWLSIRTGSGML
jgi:hypothetical protein